MSKFKSWQESEYSFFSHEKCEMFPCHEGAGEFNCLFCYCPLYFTGESCGGNFYYLENGIKSCDNCIVPHKRENFGYMMDKLKKAMAGTVDGK